MKPEFSIIIPTYNRRLTLVNAIKSVLNQTFDNFEILVVDDGSNDNTQELIKEFHGIRYFYQSNLGVCAARNRGAKESRGNWLVFLDSDDQLAPKALELLFHRVSGQYSSVIVGGFTKICDNTQYIQLPKSRDQFVPLSGTYAIKRELFDQIGGFDEELSFSENSEFFLRLRLQKIFPIIVFESLLSYFPSESGGSKNLEGQITSLQKICEKHKEKLSMKELFTYRQILGVLNLRLHRFEQARDEFYRAVQLNPKSVVTWSRYCLSFIPPLSKLLYS